MNWSEEKYRKLYIRKTATRLMWPWQARACLGEFLCVSDETGLLDVGTKDPIGTLAVLAMLPLELVEPAVAAMLETEFLEKVPRGFLITNFVEAQEATKTPAAKKRDQRERDRAKARETPESPVTESHRVSPGVPLQPSPAQPPAQPNHQPSPTTSPVTSHAKKTKPAQVELPAEIVPPKPPPAPKTPNLIAEVLGYFDQRRTEKLRELGVDPAKCPDDPPNFARSGATINAWAKAVHLEDDPHYVELHAIAMIEKYLADPWPSGLMRRDGEGKDTAQPQPYPWHVLLSEKLWRKYHEQLEAELDQRAAGAH